jgi:hypothetical protein
MRWLAVAFVTIVFLALTAGAYVASAAGCGLPGMLDKPVSIREGSVGGGGTHRHGTLLYFGSSRRHSGGGFRGGK